MKWVSRLFSMLLLVALPAVSAQAPTVEELLLRADDLLRGESSRGRMTMRVKTSRWEREVTMSIWSKGSEKTLIRIEAPAKEKGTSTLKVDQDIWNYLPKIDRTIKVPASMMSGAWMGSHFTNDDLLRETSYLDDHEGSVAWVDVGGTRYLEVTMTPRPDAPVVYTRLVYLLVPDAWTPYQAEYYDEGELVRTMTFDRVQTVSGRQIPMRMVLQPADDPNERTEIIYTDLQLDIPVDGSLFTRRGLRRVAGN